MSKKALCILKRVSDGKIFRRRLDPIWLLENTIAGRVVLNGIEYRRLVSEELAQEPITHAAPKMGGIAKWPYLSDQMGCHPEQIPEFQKMFAQHGMNVGYTRDGRMEVTTPKMRKRAAELLGLHDRNSYGTSGDASYNGKGRTSQTSAGEMFLKQLVDAMRHS